MRTLVTRSPNLTAKVVMPTFRVSGMRAFGTAEVSLRNR
jgi:hypothetical protein